jgi:hypothetical protein
MYSVCVCVLKSVGAGACTHLGVVAWLGMCGCRICACVRIKCRVSGDMCSADARNRGERGRVREVGWERYCIG